MLQLVHKVSSRLRNCEMLVGIYFKTKQNKLLLDLIISVDNMFLLQYTVINSLP